MKKMIFLSTMFFYCSCLEAYEPGVSIRLKEPIPSTLFFGDTLRIPVQMTYFALPKNYKEWSIPQGSHLEAMSGGCPAIPLDEYERGSGTCDMDLIVSGNTLGTVISGALSYNVFGGYRFNSTGFSIKVIPHPLSMKSIPMQMATAGQDFVYPLNTAVWFYNENVAAGQAPQGLVTPEMQDGLSFDKKSFAIIGKPERVGAYLFKVAVKNANGRTEAVPLHINVGVNLKDKPQFKNNYPVAIASPGEKYTINLMNLIVPKPGFMESNQVSFRLDATQANPCWLNISEKNNTILTGEIPTEWAGQEIRLSLIATSNTGGDSQSFTIKIPVANDPTKKPIMEPFALEQLAGTNIYQDLSKHIQDPAQASDLKVFLDKVEPMIPNLTISKTSLTVLEGAAPDTSGQTYKLTLRTSTRNGGSSEPIIIPLYIYKDKNQAPYFKTSFPRIPRAYSGQAFFYDFDANQDVSPEYNTDPYEISFADEFTPPYWLKLENNKLHANSVPKNLGNDVGISLVIRNTQGGFSPIYHLNIPVVEDFSSSYEEALLNN